MPPEPSSRPVSQPSPQPLNVADLARHAAGVAPDRVAFVDGERSLTWAELDADADRVAAALAGLRLEAGARVCLVLGNTLAFPVAYFGVLRAGLVAVPVNPANTPRELAHVFEDSAAAVVLSGPSALADVEAALPITGAPIVVGVDGARPSSGLVLDELPAGQGAPEAARGGEDLAVLMYTSGTSGRPRGAMLSHRALLADLEHVGRIEPSPTSPDDVVLLVLPLSHVFGLSTGLGMVARAAATGVLVDRFSAEATAALVREHGVTNLVGVPTMYQAWCEVPGIAEAFASVRLAVSGAAPLPVGVLRRFHTRAGHLVYEGYGLTETAPSVTSTLCSFEPKAGSVGRPVPGVEVVLVDRSGAEVDSDDAGEVRVRGANLFSGYWPDGADGPDEAGWWSTGDVAVADEAGDLTLVGRRTELILVSGFNVYPREVEAVLALHPDVLEVAVVGIPHPYTGSAVQAFVVLRPGSSPDAEALRTHAARLLARFKCPTAIEFVESLPHTATGKVAKGRLRETPAPPATAVPDE
jgi:long-chain acyl-CoA synthetase